MVKLFDINEENGIGIKQNGMSRYTDVLISDFLDPVFQNAFKQYFLELDFEVKDWDGLFKEINDEGGVFLKKLMDLFVNFG